MIYSALEKLIGYGVAKNLITEDDGFVVQNMLMAALELSDFSPSGAEYAGESVDELLAPIVEYAVSRGVIPDTAASRDLFDTKIMGIFTPMPREIIAKFREKYKESPEAATDWYYKNSSDLNYVRAGRIAKDMRWTYDSEYGRLDITVNRSKPEKDPRDIALAGAAKSVNYPKCQLCAENAGFAGTQSHPARQNLRPIPVKVAGGDWFLQYSPYGYYSEHCIVFNGEHIPMKIDREVFGKLFDVIDFLPHYFVGSNADLPIVGGSILSHEHFQGGKYTFAMERAEIEEYFEIPSYPTVKAGIVKWPMSVIRLSSEDKTELAGCCDLVLRAWRGYTDADAFIFAETDGTPHSTVTPIARRRGKSYECDLVLRNNVTTAERPLGLFHPAPKLHHIKKENIGLIEVMGLAVLPARLATELTSLAAAMSDGKDIRSIPELEKHAEWAECVKTSHPELTGDNAMQILRAEVGAVFLNVLCDAGVFKRTPDGKQAFRRFIGILR